MTSGSRHPVAILLILGGLAGIPARASYVTVGSIKNLTDRDFTLATNGKGVRFQTSAAAAVDPKGFPLKARTSVTVDATDDFLENDGRFTLAATIAPGESILATLAASRDPATRKTSLKLLTWEHRVEGAGARKVNDIGYTQEGSSIKLLEGFAWTRLKLTPSAGGAGENKGGAAGSAAKPGAVESKATGAQSGAGAGTGADTKSGGAGETKAASAASAGKPGAVESKATGPQSGAGAGAGAAQEHELTAGLHRDTAAIQAQDVARIKAAVGRWRKEDPGAPIHLVFGARASEAERFDPDRWIYVDHQVHGDEAAPQFFGNMNEVGHLRTLAQAVAGQVDEIHFDYAVTKFLHWNHEHLAVIQAMLAPEGVFYLALGGDGLQGEYDMNSTTEAPGTEVEDLLGLIRIKPGEMPTRYLLPRAVMRFSHEAVAAARKRFVQERLKPALRAYLEVTFAKVEPKAVLPVFIRKHTKIRPGPQPCFACSGKAGR